MRRLIAFPMLLTALYADAANTDGQVDPFFGENAGRTTIGYLDSFTPDVRAFARYPSNGRVFLFADDRNDGAALYTARLIANGLPDPLYGPNNDGRIRLQIPAGLTTMTEGLNVHAAGMQSDGKPLVAGGLYALDGDAGAYPAVVCRLFATGSFDAGFSGDGCQTIRSNLASDEICAVTDLAIDVNDLIVAVGNCSAPSIGERPFVARLTTAGAFDVEFNGGIGVVFPAAPLLSISAQHYTSVVALPDGRIAVAGDFVMNSSGVRDYEIGIAQFDNGGGYDTSFNGVGFNSFAFDLGGDNHDRSRDLVLRADGKLLALGEAKRIDTRRTIVLMGQAQADGQVDGSFGPFGKRSDEADGLLSEHALVTSLELDDVGRSVIGTSDVGVDERANSNHGTDFRFSFIYGIPPALLPQVYMTSEVATNGTIYSPGLADPINFSIAAGGTTVIALPDFFSDIADIDVVSSRGLQISTNAPISAVARSGRSYSTDATVLTPTEHLGRRYRISSWGLGSGNGSTFSIAAVESDTTVTITPSITAYGHPAGVPYQVSLDANESYWVGTAGTDVDFTGTTIIADKPVAVMAGHTCAHVPDEPVGNCETIFEQQPPIERWGTHFFAAPPINRAHGVMLRVLADHSPTLVWFDGVLVSTLQAGQSYQSIRTTATAIVTSHPALATQIETGTTYMTGVEAVGDPSLLVLEPVSRWSMTHVARVLPSITALESQEQMRIIAPSSITHQVYIDNVQLAPSNFTAIGSSGYSVAEVIRAPGKYRVSGSLPISVSTSARGSSESTELNAAVESANPSADDLILRLNANGTRDTSFGANGLSLIDHTVVSGGNQNSHDRLIRAIPLKDTIVAITDFTSPVSAQHLPLAYRLAAGALFKDGFE